MRRRSQRTSNTYLMRRVMVSHLMWLTPRCARCKRVGVDVHELIPRARGGSILLQPNLVVLCRSCHTWVTGNPALAGREGLLRNSWERSTTSSTGRCNWSVDLLFDVDYLSHGGC